MRLCNRFVTRALGSAAVWFAALIITGSLVAPVAGADSNNDQPRHVTVAIIRTSKDGAKDIVTAPKVTVRAGKTADVHFGAPTDRVEVAVAVHVVGGQPRHEVSVRFAQERDGKKDVTAAPRITVADRTPAMVSMAHGDGGTIEINATVSPTE